MGQMGPPGCSLLAPALEKAPRYSWGHHCDPQHTAVAYSPLWAGGDLRATVRT